MGSDTHESAAAADGARTRIPSVEELDAQVEQAILRAAAERAARLRTAADPRVLAWAAWVPGWSSDVAARLGVLVEAEALLPALRSAGYLVNRMSASAVVEGSRKSPSRGDNEGAPVWHVRPPATMPGSLDAALGMSEPAGRAQVRVALAEAGQRLRNEGDPQLQAWASLAQHAASGEGMADELDAKVRGALRLAQPAARTARIYDWIELARPLASLLSRDQDPTMEIALERAARLQDLERRRERDRRALENYLERPRHQTAIRDRIDAAPGEPWALHLMGAGGTGKTMLVRHTTSGLRERELPVARVDFDYLPADYPSRAPGLLLWALVQDLLVVDPNGHAESALLRADAMMVEFHRALATRRGTSGYDPLAEPAFADAVEMYVEAFGMLARGRPLVFVFDTCEELTRFVGVGDTTHIDSTFRIVEALRYGAQTLRNPTVRREALPTLRVLFSGRRLLAGAGANYEAKTSRLCPREYLVLREIRGFTNAEARTYLREKLGVPEEYVTPIVERSPDVGAVLGADVVWKDGPVGAGGATVRDDEPLCSPLDIRMFADWVLGPQRPAVDALRTAKRTGYVELRIVERLHSRVIEQALPLLAWVGHFDRGVVEEIVGPPDGRAAYEKLRDLEWTVLQPAGASATASQIVSIEPQVRRRLRELYATPPIADPAVDRLRQRFATATATGSYADVDWRTFDLAFRFQLTRPEGWLSWWAAVEPRLLEKVRDGWLERALGPSLGEEGALSLAEASDGERAPARAAVLLCFAIGLRMKGDIAAASRSREEAWALLRKVDAPAFRALRLRALAAAMDAVVELRATLEPSWVREFVSEWLALPPAEATAELVGSLTLGLEAIAVFAERNERYAPEAVTALFEGLDASDGWTIPRSWLRRLGLWVMKGRYLGRALAAWVRQAESAYEQRSGRGVGAWAFLRAQIAVAAAWRFLDTGHGAGELLEDVVDASAAQVDDPSDVVLGELILEAPQRDGCLRRVAEAGYPAHWDATYTARLLSQPDALSGAMLAGPRETTLACSACWSAILADGLGRTGAELRESLASVVGYHFTTPLEVRVRGLAATAKTPPLAVTALSAVARFGSIQAARNGLEQAAKEASATGGVLAATAADRALAVHIARLRLVAEGQFVPSSLRSSAVPEDVGLALRAEHVARPSLLGSVPMIPGSLPNGERRLAAHAIFGALPRVTPSDVARVAEWLRTTRDLWDDDRKADAFVRASVALDRYEAEADLAQGLGPKPLSRQALARIVRQSIEALSPYRPVEALEVSLRAKSLDVPTKGAERAKLATRVGAAAAGWLAFDLADGALIRRERGAGWLLEQASRWFGDAGESVGLLLARVGARLAPEGGSGEDAPIQEALDGVRASVLRGATGGGMEADLPTWGAIEHAARSADPSGLPGGHWRPWAVRIAVCLALRHANDGVSRAVRLIERYSTDADGTQVVAADLLTVYSLQHSHFAADSPNRSAARVVLRSLSDESVAVRGSVAESYRAEAALFAEGGQPEITLFASLEGHAPYATLAGGNEALILRLDELITARAQGPYFVLDVSDAAPAPPWEALLLARPGGERVVARREAPRRRIRAGETASPVVYTCAQPQAVLAMSEALWASVLTTHEYEWRAMRGADGEGGRALRALGSVRERLRVFHAVGVPLRSGGEAGLRIGSLGKPRAGAPMAQYTAEGASEGDGFTLSSKDISAAAPSMALCVLQNEPLPSVPPRAGGDRRDAMNLRVMAHELFRAGAPAVVTVPTLSARTAERALTTLARVFAASDPQDTTALIRAVSEMRGYLAQPDPDAPLSPKALQVLRDAIAPVFLKREEILMLVQDAGIRAENVDLNGPPIVIWMRVLEEANSSDAIHSLLKVMADRAPVLTDRFDAVMAAERVSAESPEDRREMAADVCLYATEAFCPAWLYSAFRG